MKVETLMQVIRNQYEGDTRSTLDYADLDQLLPALNMAMWVAKGRPQQQRVAQSATPSQASSRATDDQANPSLPDGLAPNSPTSPPPPPALQQVEQPQLTHHEASSSSSTAVTPAPSTATDSLTSSIIKSNQTGDTEATQITHLQEYGNGNASPAAQPVTTSSSNDVSAFHAQSQALSAATASNIAPRKKAKSTGLARAKSRPTFVVNPHHADMGIFAGKTVDEILTPNNGITHSSGHKDAVEKINQKRKAEGLPEMRFKDRTWNHRLEDALMHKLGRANYDSSLEEIRDARKNDQARAAYVAMLMNDQTNEHNPTSVCTEESCIGKRARAQKKSLSALNASTPANGGYGTPYATGSATASLFDGSSSETPASEVFNANAGTTAPSSLKHARDVNNAEPAFEQPDGVNIKRRKARQGRVLRGNGQAQGSDDPALDPALFSSNQAQSRAPYHQYSQQGNAGLIQNGYAPVAEAHNHPPSTFTAPGLHAATTYFDDQASDSMRTEDVDGAVVHQQVDDEQGFGEVAQSFEEITAHVGGGIDTHHDGPAPTHFDQHND
ncbi:hypothetical protein CB0940_03631 [Cercospora beticola]|uniref:Uncharacterized protein n=1 Tax=Cercospora beticola TaxID=122368 RepID=A0A2G5I2D0_CERBT|nr:hypothetical protein CB0940_03631 [Cercospora beticola]PIA98920.1 hypothetical protein CB0940_03631 [Cercospora beticola]WPB00811.1 hypothetical protein RHO25_005431 [Cercospora beticola]